MPARNDRRDPHSRARCKKEKGTSLELIHKIKLCQTGYICLLYWHRERTNIVSFTINQNIFYPPTLSVYGHSMYLISIQIFFSLPNRFNRIDRMFPFTLQRFRFQFCYWRAELLMKRFNGQQPFDPIFTSARWRRTSRSFTDRMKWVRETFIQVLTSSVQIDRSEFDSCQRVAQAISHSLRFLCESRSYQGRNRRYQLDIWWDRYSFSRQRKWGRGNSVVHSWTNVRTHSSMDWTMHSSLLNNIADGDARQEGYIFWQQCPGHWRTVVSQWNRCQMRSSCWYSTIWKHRTSSLLSSFSNVVTLVWSSSFDRFRRRSIWPTPRPPSSISIRRYCSVPFILTEPLLRISDSIVRCCRNCRLASNRFLVCNRCRLSSGKPMISAFFWNTFRCLRTCNSCTSAAMSVVVIEFSSKRVSNRICSNRCGHNCGRWRSPRHRVIPFRCKTSISNKRCSPTWPWVSSIAFHRHDHHSLV